MDHFTTQLQTIKITDLSSIRISIAYCGDLKSELFEDRFQMVRLLKDRAIAIDIVIIPII